ncbi:hypothetical protein [Nocardia farcinica]|uniref:hypothetical protein n=1 Tax=Nocardia farcinica TaxID=37329 RepID=UPI001B3C984F|nr:hypothetical protein [Nocardia farcinica]MBF6535968.1 hypothetical protein [Nocardia farcinica]
MSLRRMICLVLMAAVGVLLIAFPFATSMFDKARGVDGLTDDFRYSFTAQSLDQTDADMATVHAMSDELREQLLPALPEALGMTTQQLDDFMSARYPEAAAGIAQLEIVVPRFEGLVIGLKQQAGNFRQADAIPTSSLPAQVVPFLFVMPGALLVLVAGIGSALLATGRGHRWTSITAVVSVLVGLVFLTAPFALSLPSKARAVDELTTSFQSTFSESGVEVLQRDLMVVRAMTVELHTRTVPDLAQATGMNPEQFARFLGQNFPQVATGMQQIDGILDRFDAFAAGIEANLEDFRLAASIPTAGTSTTALLYWFLMPGAALVILGVIAAPGPRHVREPQRDVRRVLAAART